MIGGYLRSAGVWTVTELQSYKGLYVDELKWHKNNKWPRIWFPVRLKVVNPEGVHELTN
jgi:hypothetical protein